MNIATLIAALTAYPDRTHVAPFGFEGAHSWRGSYDEIAFSRSGPRQIRDMLADAIAVDGATFRGWKGGEYTMSHRTWVHLATPGSSQDADGTEFDVFVERMIGATMLAASAPAVIPPRRPANHPNPVGL